MDNSEQMERLEHKIDLLVRKDRIKTWAFIALTVILAICLIIAGVKLKQAYNTIELTLSEYEELGEHLKDLGPDAIDSITETIEKLQGLDVDALDEAFEKLNDLDTAAINEAMEKLQDFDPDALNETVEKLKDFDPEVLNEAVEKLNEFDPDALNDVVDKLQQVMKKFPGIF